MSYRELVIADGASHYWRLDDVAADVFAIDTVGGAHGTVSGGVTRGQPGALASGDAAMTFDGTTGTIATTAAVVLPVVCTIEGWIQTTATTQRPLFSSWFTANIPLGPRLWVGMGTATSLFVITAGTSATIPCGPLNDHAWHHVVAVLSGTTVQGYLDGVALPGQPLVRASASSGPATIGWGADNGDFWAGSLDEVAIYPLALSAAQVAAHYAARLDSGAPTPVLPGTRTYRDLIEASLQDLQIVGAGDTLSPEDAQLGLDRLNDWIDALALEGLTIPTHTRVTWPLVPGQSNYAVGLSGPVAIVMPAPVNARSILDIGYYDAALPTVTEVLFGGVLTDAALLAMPQKFPRGPVPTSFYYQVLFTGIGYVYPLPIPTRSTLVGVLYPPARLTEVALTDVVTLPAGYRRFVRSHLTVELAAAFEQPVPAAIARIASESMARIKTANLRMSDLGFAIGVPGLTSAGYDITTDT